MTPSTRTTESASPTPRRRRRRGRIALTLALLVFLSGAAVSGWAWWHGSIAGVALRPHCTATASGSTAELDPEQAANAAVIAGIALRRGLPGRAATIGIAVAMQESKLRNLDGGDLDSSGLFQQRPSQGWGTVEQVRDPVHATNAFYDVLVKIDGYQNLSVTAVAQQVQRSAFPTAYADHEPQARIWASTLTGYSPAALSCVLAAVPEAPAQAPGKGGLTPRAQALVTAATTTTGRAGTALAGGDGHAVRWAPAAKEPTRTAWALAQWAVASADALGVVAVEVDGKHWQRSESTKGWTPLAGAGPGAGAVVVRVTP